MTYLLELNFADAEAPVRVGDTQLVLQHAPSPALSLQFFRNGVLQTAGGDYLLAGFTILPTTPPTEGDQFICWYRFET